MRDARGRRIARLASASWLVLALFLAPASSRAQLPAGVLAQRADQSTEPSSSRRVVPHVPGGPVTVELHEGEELRAATCGAQDAAYVGDTTLALVAPNGERVAFNDDACSSLGSSLRFVVPSGRSGTYVIQPGCYAGGACGGAIAIEVGPATAEAQAQADAAAAAAPRVPGVRVLANARGVIGVERDEGAVVGDLLVEARLVGPLLLRFGGSPAGISGGERGGLAGGSLTLTLGFDAGVFALGAGAGISVLATRLASQQAQETPSFVTFLRIGRLDLFHFEAQLAVWIFDDVIEILSFQGLARLPLGPVDLFLRGAGGHDGIVLGELGVVVWTGDDHTFGISAHVGGAGVFHQSVCRFGVPCPDTRWITGPALGVGFEWRP